MAGRHQSRRLVLALVILLDSLGADRALAFCLVRPGSVSTAATRTRTRRRGSVRPPAEDETEKAPVVLPLDFGSGDVAWRFEWPPPETDDEAAPLDVASSDASWDARDVVVGATCFLACHLNALVLCGGDIAVARPLATGAFVALQLAAGTTPFVPVERGLSLFDWAKALRWRQTVPVEKVGDVPWFFVALGASVPVFQAVLLPIILSRGDSLFPAIIRAPTLGFDTVLLIPICEELVFRVWGVEALRRARCPYLVAIALDGVAFGLWHGAQPTSIGFAVLGMYWAHMYAQTRNGLIPIAMHAAWNAFALTNQATFGFFASSQ